MDTPPTLDRPPQVTMDLSIAFLTASIEKMLVSEVVWPPEWGGVMADGLFYHSQSESDFSTREDEYHRAKPFILFLPLLQILVILKKVHEVPNLGLSRVDCLFLCEYI